jgi:hypothetical protein
MTPEENVDIVAENRPLVTAKKEHRARDLLTPKTLFCILFSAYGNRRSATE